MQDKTSTVLSRKAEITELLRKNTVDVGEELVSLRKFWVENRLRLWLMKEFISKHVNQASEYVCKILQTLSDGISSAVELTEGNLHFTFGDTGRSYQTQFNVHIGTNTIMEHIALPTASLIKYSDKDCWVCLSLVPNPECVSTIDNLVLALLAKSTYEKITQEDASLVHLFGYDIQ